MNKRSQFVMLLFVCVAAGSTLAAVAAPVTTTYTYDKIGNIKLVGNTSSDPANCGAVSNACAAGDPCCGGTCRVSEPTNCGGCGVSCSSNHVTPACSGGSCAAGVCAAGWGDCNGNKQGDGCETALTTTANCGGCGIACSANHVTPACSGGSCAAGVCAAGWGDCNGNKQGDGCETALTTTANCGGCGIACSANHVTPACSGGSCAAGVCAAGWGDCNGNKQADGCETALSTTANCGGCGIACSANHVTPACSGGSCATGVCAAGWSDCNGNKQVDGCETDLAASTANCGGCGVACSANHVTPACSGGSCAAGVCTAGWGDCNGNKQADGCETDLATSTAHCGGCGIACSANHVTPACSGGSCAAGVCAAGWGDCNGNKQADGCETDLATSTANCGGCGIACSANHVTPACSGGSCAAGVCAAGWGDCNGNKQGDGCETDLTTSTAHCGGCGIACSANHATPACSGGSCAAGVCAAGWGDCNGNKQADGCETPLITTSNCGACGRVCAAGQVCSGGACVTSPPPPKPKTCSGGRICCEPDGAGGCLVCAPRGGQCP